MAHSCSIDVCIKGPADRVQKIANQINAEGGLRCDIFASLQQSGIDLQFSYINEAEVRESEGRTYLFLTAYILERQDSSCWQEVDFPTGIFYALHSEAINLHITNDTEGVCFVYPYHVVIAEDKEAFFMTKDEVRRYLDRYNVCLADTWYYAHTDIGKVCPPISAMVIQCLYSALSAELPF